MNLNFGDLRKRVLSLPADEQVEVLADEVEAYTRRVCAWYDPVLYALGHARYVAGHVWGSAMEESYVHKPDGYHLELVTDGGAEHKADYKAGQVHAVAAWVLRAAQGCVPPEFGAFRAEVERACDLHADLLASKGLEWHDCRVASMQLALRKYEPEGRVLVSLHVARRGCKEESAVYNLGGMDRWYGWGGVPRMREAVADFAGRMRPVQVAVVPKRSTCEKMADCPLFAWGGVEA